REGLGGADVLHAVPFPQAIRPPESSQPAFGRNAGSSKNHNVANVAHAANLEAAPRLCYALAFNRGTQHGGIGNRRIVLPRARPGSACSLVQRASQRRLWLRRAECW